MLIDCYLRDAYRDHISWDEHIKDHFLRVSWAWAIAVRTHFDPPFFLLLATSWTNQLLLRTCRFISKNLQCTASLTFQDKKDTSHSLHNYFSLFQSNQTPQNTFLKRTLFIQVLLSLIINKLHRESPSLNHNIITALKVTHTSHIYKETQSNLETNYIHSKWIPSIQQTTHWSTVTLHRSDQP